MQLFQNLPKGIRLSTYFLQIFSKENRNLHRKKFEKIKRNYHSVLQILIYRCVKPSPAGKGDHGGVPRSERSRALGVRTGGG